MPQRAADYSVGLAAVLLLTGCGSAGGGSDSAAPAPATPGSMASAPAPTLNINASHTELTLAENQPVGRETPKLIWANEFDAPQLDAQRWFFESGDGSQYGIPGWGNNELQWYLPDSATLEDGHLVITAREQSVQGMRFTSARIHTRDRLALRYGRIEARMRFPAGQGLRTAFSLLPQDESYGTWAASGEIDIVESVNLGVDGNNDVLHTLHFGGTWPDNAHAGGRYTVASSATDDFHVYAIEWDDREMRWYVDGLLAHSESSWHSSGGDYPAPFDQPFYLLLNLSVGGNLPGEADASTLPARFDIDYVRVYSG